MKRIILDTDTGIDDGMAVVQAVLDPRVELVGLTTVFGNVNVDLVTENTLRLVEMLGSDIPVAPGAGKGLLGQPTFSPHVHGDDGQGNMNYPPPSKRQIDRHAAQFIINEVRRAPHLVTLVAVGPLTNLALAVSLDPSIQDLVESVVWMGGTAERSGNVSPVAEADAWHDPEAAQVVLEARWPVTMVGLDVTDFVRLSEADVERCGRSGTAAGRWLAEVTPFYLDFYETVLGVRECPMHSGLALEIAVDPSMAIRAPQLPVAVELASSLTRGMTVVDRRALRDGDPSSDAGRGVRVVLEVDGDLYRKRFIELICDQEGR